MRPTSPSMSLENGPVTPRKPAGLPSSDPPASAQAAIMNGDLSALINGETSAFQPQPTVASSSPPFFHAATIQNQNTAVPPNSGFSSVAQIAFQPLRDAPASAQLATTNGDLSTPINGEPSTFQPQPAVASLLPPFSHAANQNTAVPPNSSVAQIAFQPLQATADPQTSFHSASQSGGPQQTLFSGDTQPAAHHSTPPFTPTSLQPQPQCFFPTINSRFRADGQVQQQSLFPGANVDSILHPQHQQFSFCDTHNHSTSRQETLFPFPATTTLNPVFQVSNNISFSPLLTIV